MNRSPSGLYSTLVFGAMGTLWATVCLASPILITDFSSGAPAGTSVSGDAVVEDGVLKLTEAVGGQSGFFFINDLDPGNAVGSFTASFTAYVGGGTCCGDSNSTPGLQTADGFSFNFANDLPATFQGEEGGGTGLTVSFDSWDNQAPDEAPVIDVFWDGALVGQFPTTISQGLLAPVDFWAVLIRLDSDGTLDVSYNNVLIVSNLLTGYTPILGGQFAFGARTGGANDNHWIDDLSIETQPGSAVPVPEPASLLLLGTGGLGLIARLRRRRGQQS